MNGYGLKFMGLMMLGLGLVVRNVEAEKHTIRFNNRCGHGSPHLLKNGNVLSQGEDFVSNGPFTSGIAYLQTGDCNLNGEGCTVVEMSLLNPACIGCGSSTDISLIPPLRYSVPTSFSYFNGCDGHGATCSSPDCGTAFFVPDDNHVQVSCQDDDVSMYDFITIVADFTLAKVGLLITFCPGGGLSEVTTTSKESISKEITTSSVTSTSTTLAFVTSTLVTSSTTSTSTTSTLVTSSTQIPTKVTSDKAPNQSSSAFQLDASSSLQPSSQSSMAQGPTESNGAMASTVTTGLRVPTRKCDRSHAKRRTLAAKLKRRVHKKRMGHEKRFGV